MCGSEKVRNRCVHCDHPLDHLSLTCELCVKGFLAYDGIGPKPPKKRKYLG